MGSAYWAGQGAPCNGSDPFEVSIRLTSRTAVVENPAQGVEFFGTEEQRFSYDDLGRLVEEDQQLPLFEGTQDAPASSVANPSAGESWELDLESTQGYTVGVAKSMPAGIKGKKNFKVLSILESANNSRLTGVQQEKIGAAPVGSQYGEVFLDRVKGLLRKYKMPDVGISFALAIGNVGGHELGHLLGRRDSPMPEPVGCWYPDIMVRAFTPCTITSEAIGFH